MSTAYVYDPLYLQHGFEDHPENRRRLEQTLQHLQDSGLLTRMSHLEARDATLEEVAAVHLPGYITLVRDIAARGGGALDADTDLTSQSYAAALRAAGGLLRAVEAVLGEAALSEAKGHHASNAAERHVQVDNAFALVRPPGHHALPGRGMGFCLFNNIAIAARYALNKHGLQRVLIVDFDLHHGNGTQDAFYEEPRVLFFSTHQYPYYPGTGHWQETGRGAGRGYTVNVPLPAGTGDAGYQRVFEQILVPIARRFQPELILVSAGYDAHWMDPIGMMLLSVSGYAQMMRTLVALANELCAGRLVLTLEGGYNLKALAASIAATFSVLLGDEQINDPFGPARHAEEDVDTVIQAVKRVHGLE